MRTRRFSSTSLALSTILVLSCGLCGGAYKIGRVSRGGATTPAKSIGLREVVPRMRDDMLEMVYAKNVEKDDTPPGPIIFSKLEDVASFTGTPWPAGCGLGSHLDEKRSKATASPPEISSDFAQWEEERRRLISLVERTKKDADAAKDKGTQAAKRSGEHRVFADRKVEKHPRMLESDTQLRYKKNFQEEWSSRRQGKDRFAVEGSQDWTRATPVKRRLDFADFAVAEASNNGPGTDEMSIALESCSA